MPLAPYNRPPKGDRSEGCNRVFDVFENLNFGCAEIVDIVVLTFWICCQHFEFSKCPQHMEIWFSEITTKPSSYNKDCWTCSHAISEAEEAASEGSRIVQESICPQLVKLQVLQIRANVDWKLIGSKLSANASHVIVYVVSASVAVTNVDGKATATRWGFWNQHASTTFIRQVLTPSWQCQQGWISHW